MSKTQKIKKARDKLVYHFSSYAKLADNWDPRKEDDFNELVSVIDETLEELLQ